MPSPPRSRRVAPEVVQRSHRASQRSRENRHIPQLRPSAHRWHRRCSCVPSKERHESRRVPLSYQENVMRKLMITAFAACLSATPAFAQDKPVEVNFGFGWTFPTTDFKNSFDAGWHGTAGVTFWANPKLGFLVDYTYNKMDGPERTINVAQTPIVGAPTTSALLEANHQIHAVTFDAV